MITIDPKNKKTSAPADIRETLSDTIDWERQNQLDMHLGLDWLAVNGGNLGENAEAKVRGWLNIPRGGESPDVQFVAKWRPRTRDCAVKDAIHWSGVLRSNIYSLLSMSAIGAPPEIIDNFPGLSDVCEYRLRDPRTGKQKIFRTTLSLYEAYRENDMRGLELSRIYHAGTPVTLEAGEAAIETANLLYQSVFMCSGISGG